jgi:hypothetical protein
VGPAPFREAVSRTDFLRRHEFAAIAVEDLSEWGKGGSFGVSDRSRIAAFAAFIGLVTLWPALLAAQQFSPAGGMFGVPPAGAPRALKPLQTMAPIEAPAPNAAPAPSGTPPVTLSLSARYGREFPSPITNGLLWRVFPAKPDSSGMFRILKEDKTASPIIALPPGDYVIHVSFGLANAVKAIHLKDAVREVFDLPAGGIKIEGRVGDARVPPNQITFDIFKGSQFAPGDKTVLVQGVLTGDVVVVPEGNYHIVSNYGDTNAVVRSDIMVHAGKLTDVTVNHHAALITLKLVNARGGEALADTSWSVITPGGDVVKEFTGVFPRIVLAEGDYRAIARNEGHTYERDFRVLTGVDGEVEVLAH